MARNKTKINRTERRSSGQPAKECNIVKSQSRNPGNPTTGYEYGTRTGSHNNSSAKKIENRRPARGAGISIEF